MSKWTLVTGASPGIGAERHLHHLLHEYVDCNPSARSGLHGLLS